MPKTPISLRVFALVFALAGMLLLAPVATAQVSELKPNLQAFPAADLAVVPVQGGVNLIFKIGRASCRERVCQYV